MKKLSGKQKLFIQHYMVSLNASEAARLAGYSPKTAFRMGQENMQKPAILAAIAVEQTRIKESLSWDADFVREQMKEVLQECRDTNQNAVASGLLNTMSKVMGMQSDNLKIDSKSSISFNIKTGKK